MQSAGKRATGPPNRLIDQLLQPDRPKIVIMTTTAAVITTTTTTTTTNSNSHPVTVVSSGNNQKPEPTLQDLLSFMKNHRNEQRNDLLAVQNRLEGQINSFTQRQDAVETRVTTVEHDVSILSQAIDPLTTEVNTLRAAVTKLQMSNVTSNASVCTSNFQPPLNSTHFVNGASFSSTSLNLSESLSDVVSQFTGIHRDLHPEKFLQQLDQYFQNHNLSDEQRIGLFQRRLSSNARTWFESLMPSPITYKEVTCLLRQQFWSASTQRKVRNEIFRPYQYRSPTGIAHHAMMWIAKAKYLTPPIDPFDLVGIIIQHYPSSLGMAVRGRGPKTTNELLSVLTEIEESASFCDTPPAPRPSDTRVPSSGQNNNQRGGYSNNYRGRGGFQNNRNNDYRNDFRNNSSPGTRDRPQLSQPIDEPIHQLNVSGNADEARA